MSLDCLICDELTVLYVAGLAVVDHLLGLLHHVVLHHTGYEPSYTGYEPECITTQKPLGGLQNTRKNTSVFST